MKTFLTQVAEHYNRNKEALRKTMFIFPNRRSLLYFKTEIKKLNAGDEDVYAKGCSINDFLQKLYGVETTDRIRLVLALYESYKELNDKPESLDDFIHWGRIMISDFDNIDKYLVDAKKIFVNVKEFRDIQDTYQYLTDAQREAIEHFLDHFKDSNGRITVEMDEENDTVKSRFLKVWNLLGPLYEKFNERLQAEGMTYEGKVYRSLADKLNAGTPVKSLVGVHFKNVDKFVFVGLNALNECEKTILRALRDEGMAEFVWDFSSKELRNPRNKASFFMRQNIEAFPQAMSLDTEEPLRRPTVKVISVPSGVGQTKLAPQIISELGQVAGETAFVLPEESLLLPLLSALPAGCEQINITMGYPMDKSAIYSLLKAEGMLHLTQRVKDGTVYYHYKAVSNILSSCIFKSILTPEDKDVAEKVKSEAKQFIPAEDLDGSEIMKAFFSPIYTTEGQTLLNPTIASAQQNHLIESRLRALILIISANICKETDEANPYSIHADMEMEFAARYFDILNAISKIDIDVTTGTYLRLLDGLLHGESVPFEGDALQGLQVMGTLETRALDFKNIIILNANEDLFPHRSADNSFIPPELRKGFGMPTIDYQDAVWSYYFYRMIQRAENVWMIYDSRTEGLLSGEESRYIKQLEYHFRFPVQRYTAIAPISPDKRNDSIEKTAGDIDTLRNDRHLSASSLQSYLACPAKFYYQAVKGLKSEDEVAESLDASMIGTIFHKVMETLYSNKKTVTSNDLNDILSDETRIRGLIREGILEHMKTIEVEGRNLIIEEVLLQYVQGAVRHDLSLLRESGSEGFRIIGLERYVRSTIDGFPVIGFIDRIDTYRNGEVRIVDYKTGHVEKDDILINDDNAQAVADKLFGPSNTGRPKIALQLYLYDQFAHEGLLHPGEKVINSIYSTAKLLTTSLPDVEESAAFSDTVKQKLHETLSEIADTSIPWKRTEDKHVCAMCDFRSICGR